MLGVLSTSEALSRAEEAGVDLVEISPTADPPVCKIIEYGKMLYSLKKKEQKTKQATKAREQKGIRLTFKIDVGDLERQRKLAEKFLTDGHPVRVQMKLRGREKAHASLAVTKTKTFLASLEAVGRVDQSPSISGFQVTAMLRPNK
jgi:translation initiation factor IF-3